MSVDVFCLKWLSDFSECISFILPKQVLPIRAKKQGWVAALDVKHLNAAPVEINSKTSVDVIGYIFFHVFGASCYSRAFPGLAAWLWHMEEETGEDDVDSGNCGCCIYWSLVLEGSVHLSMWEDSAACQGRKRHRVSRSAELQFIFLLAQVHRKELASGASTVSTTAEKLCG